MKKVIHASLEPQELAVVGDGVELVGGQALKLISSSTSVVQGRKDVSASELGLGNWIISNLVHVVNSLVQLGNADLEGGDSRCQGLQSLQFGSSILIANTLECSDILGQASAVFEGRRQDLRSEHGAEGVGLNDEILGIALLENQVARLELRLSEDAELGQHVAVSRVQKLFKGLRAGLDVGKTTLLSLLNPCIRVTITFKADSLGRANELLDNSDLVSIRGVGPVTHLSAKGGSDILHS